MCISTAKFSILINGSPKDYFGASNGLRQGDPLSLLLFIMTTYIFNRMLALAVESQLIASIQHPNNGSNVTNI